MEYLFMVLPGNLPDKLQQSPLCLVVVFLVRSVARHFHCLGQFGSILIVSIMESYMITSRFLPLLESAFV